MDLRDLREPDRRVLAVTTGIVEQVRDDQLDLPTPCDGWTVADLLRHMVGNNNGFAAAALGEPPAAEVWDGVHVTDPVGEFAASAARVDDAFAAVEPLAGTFAVLGYGDVPAGQAVGMHFIDYLTHGWDVAVSIGADPRLDEEACAAVLRIGSGWPLDSPKIWGPGTAFGYRVEVPDDAPVADRMLGFLGRSPRWPK
ncbi:TIGR03086 family metal-binding protein [Actinophytocola sp. NPDC049390]|uniref:TIGR03086 family metal-binding protein n=1 Tax=Actinophytocola sp. NPDC049390 TaxID=3363894 RepID=UPI00379BA164